MASNSKPISASCFRSQFSVPRRFATITPWSTGRRLPKFLGRCSHLLRCRCSSKLKMITMYLSLIFFTMFLEFDGSPASTVTHSECISFFPPRFSWSKEPSCPSRQFLCQKRLKNAFQIARLNFAGKCHATNLFPNGNQCWLARVTYVHYSDWSRINLKIHIFSVNTKIIP